MTLLEEIKRPFNLITLTMALISIMLSIIFYYNGKNIKEISYSINNESSLIFDSKNSTSKIKLIEFDSVKIPNNVYLISGTIWNSGNKPILKEDIRKSLTIELSKKSRILDYKIVKEKEKEISKFYLSQICNNILEVHWSYFDPDYGFYYQIIYTSEDISEINIKGKVLDISDFRKVKPNKSRFTSTLLLLSLSFITIILLVIIIIKKYKRNNGVDYPFLLLLIIYIIYFVYTLFTRIINPNTFQL